jgi:LmbE family N-acetylglucosaminyl deacetylase
VIAAHSDDPIIGMGGTIMNLSSFGYDVTVMSVCGDRINGFEEAIKSLNARPIHLNFSYGNIDESKLKEYLEDFIKSFDFIFTHWSNEILYDHEIVSKISLETSRRLEKEIFMFEIPASSIGFEFDFAVDISDSYESKVEAIETMRKAFESKIFEEEIYPSILYTSGFRGIQVGCKFAEVFKHCGSRFPLAPYKIKKIDFKNLFRGD